MGDARSALAVVRDLGGRASTAEITVATTRWALRTAIDEGRLERVGRGVYAVPGLPGTLTRAAGLRGTVSHLSAAKIWGLSLLYEPATLHVTVPHGHRRAPRRGVTLHQARELDAEDLRRGVTSPLRTVLDCSATLPFVQALAVADSALAFAVVGKDELLAAARATRGRGRPACIRVAEHADGRAANAFESALRGVLVEAGLTGFVPQLTIRTAGTAARVDLADEQQRIVVEADSYEHHGTREGWERDCRRYDDLVAAGWSVLRFTWRDVVDRPDQVAQLVKATGGHRNDAKTGGRLTRTPRTVPT